MRLRLLPLYALVAFVIAFTIGAPFASAAGCCTCTGDDPNKKICIRPGTVNGSCGNMPSASTNAAVKGLTNCTEDPICKTIADQGTCNVGPVDEISYGATGNSPVGGKIYELVTPSLNVDIPGLVFGNTAQEVDGYIEIPLFAQYVAAAYKYLTIISAIAAAVMITYGGFLYIVAASGANVKRGKTIIVDAVIGLILVTGAYVVLQTINPEALKLNAIKLKVVRPCDALNEGQCTDNGANAMQFVGVSRRSQAPSDAGSSSNQMTTGGNEYIPPASTAAFPTDLTIPIECPGRDPKYVPTKDEITGYNLGVPDNTLAIPLDADTISAYLEEQSRTGIPMGVIIGQILSETGGNKCIVQNLFKDPAKCGSADFFKYYNFGGVGCTPSQVPAGTCAHASFTPGQNPMNKSQVYAEGGCDAPDGPNKTTYNSQNKICQDACRSTTLSAYAASVDCGPKCYPQISHSSGLVNGVQVWYPSLQCSRKYNNAREFLDDHLGFARFCLPYNDSAYKFAYCIGASGYGGAGLKPAYLARVIERNCLCGSKDSTGCKRDATLEKNLATYVWREAALIQFAHTCTKFDAKKKCIDPDYFKSGPDYPGIIKALKDATHGSLDAHEYPQAIVP